MTTSIHIGAGTGYVRTLPRGSTTTIHAPDWMARDAAGRGDSQTRDQAVAEEPQMNLPGAVVLRHRFLHGVCALTHCHWRRKGWRTQRSLV